MEGDAAEFARPLSDPNGSVAGTGFCSTAGNAMGVAEWLLAVAYGAEDSTMEW